MGVDSIFLTLFNLDMFFHVCMHCRQFHTILWLLKTGSEIASLGIHDDSLLEVSVIRDILHQASTEFMMIAC